MHNPTEPFVVKHEAAESSSNGSIIFCQFEQAMERALIEEENIQKQKERAQQRAVELQRREEERKIAAAQKLVNQVNYKIVCQQKEQQQTINKENVNVNVNQKTIPETDQPKVVVPTNISNLTGQQLIKQKQQKLEIQFEKVFVLDPTGQQDQEKTQEQQNYNNDQEQQEQCVVEQDEIFTEKQSQIQDQQNGDQTLDESSVKFWQDNESFAHNEQQGNSSDDEIEESLHAPEPTRKLENHEQNKNQENDAIISPQKSSCQNELSLKHCTQQDSQFQLSESNCSDTFLRNFSKLQTKGLEQIEVGENQLLVTESKESESFNTQNDNINIFLKEQMDFLQNLDCQSKKLQGKLKNQQQETIQFLNGNQQIKEETKEEKDQANLLVQQFLKSAGAEPTQESTNCEQAIVQPQLNFKKQLRQEEFSNEKPYNQQEQSEIFDYSSSDNELDEKRESYFNEITQKQNNYVMVDPNELQMQEEAEENEIDYEVAQELSIEQQKNCKLEINFLEDIVVDQENQNMTLADHFKKKKAQLEKRMEKKKSKSKNKDQLSAKRTKEDILKARKEMMKPNYIKNQLQGISDEELDDTKKPINENKELMNRLAFGIKADVTKKEMRALTTKNYSQLPEIQKKNEKEKKHQEFKDRQQKVKELSQKVRNNLLFKMPDF